jgi:hypothetical protein
MFTSGQTAGGSIPPARKDPMMRFLTLLVVLFASSAVAQDVIVSRRPVTVVTAQDHAVYLARRGAFYHSSCGQYEGIGMGSTPDQARRNSCYYGKRQIVDEGVAWSPLRGRWIAVIRYR